MTIPVAWQRYSNVLDIGWKHIESDEVEEWKRLGYPIRALYASPSQGEPTTAEIERLREALGWVISSPHIAREVARSALRTHKAPREEREKSAAQGEPTELERAQTNVRHWREECGKLNARAATATEWKDRAEASERRASQLQAERDEAIADAAGWNKITKARVDGLTARASQLQAALTEVRNWDMQHDAFPDALVAIIRAAISGEAT